MQTQPRIDLYFWVHDFIDKVSPDLRERVLKDAFKKENGLAYLLPVGTKYEAESEEFGGEINAVIDSISYNPIENVITVDLVFQKIRAAVDYNLTINFLLNPAHGWVQD